MKLTTVLALEEQPIDDIYDSANWYLILLIQKQNFVKFPITMVIITNFMSMEHRSVYLKYLIIDLHTTFV